MQSFFYVALHLLPQDCPSALAFFHGVVVEHGALGSEKVFLLREDRNPPHYATVRVPDQLVACEKGADRAIASSTS